MTMIGYARVSTKGQDLTIQLEALEAAGCSRSHIYHEKESGARSDRPQLRRLLKKLEPGDVVVVTRLDRWARSSRDLQNTVHDVTAAGAQFKSLGDTWCDTTSPQGKLILAVMGGLAEFERSLIMARTQAGIAKARANKVPSGRKPSLTPQQKKLIGDRYAKGETITMLAKDFGVGVGTIHRALHGGEQL